VPLPARRENLVTSSLMGGADDLASGTWLQRRPGAAEALRIRKCQLEVVAGPDAGHTEVCGSSTVLIGRAGAHLVLNDRKVSGMHCEIHLEEAGYRLRDLGSTNGTYCNGLRVVEAYVQPGVTIALGDSVVRFTPLGDSVEMPLWNESRMCGLIGGSPLMRRLFDDIARIAATNATVLVTGETGAGKELVAEAIHERSPRADGPFVVLDCGAVPPRLFEDQLFGHEEGAFTGANRRAIGVFEAAHGGTLFVDEIGELPLDMQPKLLRAVETRRIRRIGGTEPIDCDVRLVAATNRDLAVEVNRGGFRADLYYRVAVAKLHVPPLRDRIDDLDALATHFAELAGGPTVDPLPAEFFTWARTHAWPGNVRELRNAVERAVALHQFGPGEDTETTAALPLDVDISVPFKQAKQTMIDAFDRRYVTRLLEAHDWNISAAARAAGVDRMSIYKLLTRLGIRN
jgi:transcriptional regulator with GAF, ATPase, and Fis domain